MRTVLVLGLDSFGEAVALTLASKGVDVIAVDRDEAALQHVRDRVSAAIVTDVRDRAALKEVCAREVDLAVVSLGSQVEPSVLATLLLKELHVPQVVACARNDDHEKVLLKVGADRVVQPMRDPAERLALSVASKNLVDFVLVGEDFAIVESPVPAAYAGKALKDLDLRRRFRLTVIAVKHRDPEVEGGERVDAPDPEEPLHAEDMLLIIGRTKDLEKLQRR